jgi:ribosome-associated toxin RatA of RatAB toxin-antitoxin module
MKQVKRSALLPYSCEQMFDVVNDVISYPVFLPWCDASEIIEQSDREMVARLTLAKAGMRQSFTTRNRLERPNAIDMGLVDGPFRSLEGHWRFSALGDDGCKVDMNLRFDFSSKLANMALGKVFEQAADSLVDAFCIRAEKLYQHE